MKQKLVHQWRDWFLEYIGEGKYELIEKNNLSVHTITANSHIDAENRSQVIINKTQREQKLDMTDRAQS